MYCLFNKDLLSAKGTNRLMKEVGKSQSLKVEHDGYMVVGAKLLTVGGKCMDYQGDKVRMNDRYQYELISSLKQ